MPSRLLLDTHILVRWLADSSRLSGEQLRAIRNSIPYSELLAVSAMSVLEIAMLAIEGRLDIKVNLEDLFHQLDTNPIFHVMPITTAIASQAAAFLSLRDSADRVIVATARVHRLTLLTSDRRIIDSGLVTTVD